MAEGAADDAEVKSRVRAASKNDLRLCSRRPCIEIADCERIRMSTKPSTMTWSAILQEPEATDSPLLPALETLAVMRISSRSRFRKSAKSVAWIKRRYLHPARPEAITTAAGRRHRPPILYKSTKEFLLRFGLKDVGELPSMEEFEKLVAESFQNELLPLSDSSVDAAPLRSALRQPSPNRRFPLPMRKQFRSSRTLPAKTIPPLRLGRPIFPTAAFVQSI